MYKIIKYFYLTLRWKPKTWRALDQSRSGSNGNEGIFNIPKSCRTKARRSDSVISGHSLGGASPIRRDAVGVFYNPSIIIITIIVISRCLHGSPRSSLATRLYRPSLPGKSSRLHLHRAVVYRSSWSSCLYSSMWRGSLEYIAYGFVLTSPAVSRFLVLVQYSSQHSCVIAIKLFSPCVK